jgi:hypothetical protein
VRDIAQHLDEADLELVFRLRLRDDEPVALVGDEGGSRHPVEWLEPAGVVVNEDGAVGLEDQEAYRLREDGRETAGVNDLAAGDDETH